MNDTVDFVTNMHEELGEHYQRIMLKHKGTISADTALQVAATLTAAQNHATYTYLLKTEIAALRHVIATQAK